MGILGLITLLTSHIALSGSWLDWKNRKVEEGLIKFISEDIKTDARNLDISPSLLGYTDLRHYCRAKGLQCENFSWQISILQRSFGNLSLSYKIIDVYRRMGNIQRHVVRFSTEGDVMAYVDSLDSQLASLCSILYNYQKSMRNLYGVDKNLLARDEGQCVYDGDNRVFCYADGRCIEKEIPCTNGWLRGENFPKIMEIAGNIARGFEFNNTNIALQNPLCRMDRDLMLIRREVQRGKYLYACCGY